MESGRQGAYRDAGPGRGPVALEPPAPGDRLAGIATMGAPRPMPRGGGAPAGHAERFVAPARMG